MVSLHVPTAFGLSMHTNDQPMLETDRLILRPFTESDAPDVQYLANDARIAEMTANIPYPYPEGAALKWIRSHAERYKADGSVSFAVTGHETAQLYGAIGLQMKVSEATHEVAELGYWIGVEFWGKGYASEACKRIVEYGLNEMRLDRVTARCLSHNPASGRVLEKAGLKHTRTAQGHCGEVLSKLEYYDISHD